MGWKGRDYPQKKEIVKELEKLQAEESAKYEGAIEEKEDEIFESFAKEAGVENIREFEV